jgi:hypothetical protein
MLQRFILISGKQVGKREKSNSMAYRQLISNGGPFQAVDTPL